MLQLGRLKESGTVNAKIEELRRGAQVKVVDPEFTPPPPAAAASPSPAPAGDKPGKAK